MRMRMTRRLMGSNRGFGSSGCQGPRTRELAYVAFGGVNFNSRTHAQKNKTSTSTVKHKPQGGGETRDEDDERDRKQ